MKRLFAVLGGVLLLVCVTVAARTARYGREQPPVEPAPVVAVPEEAAARLAGALRIRTVSHEDPGLVEAEAFQALHAYLESTFPRVHARLRREVVAGYSLLYTWPGADPSLKPILLMGHMDVVPVEPGTETQWQEDPFGGRIEEGFVWGRGAIDNKSAVVGTLEAVELLLAEGFRPARTVLLAYGHDEELGGTRGARAIAELLEERGIRLEMVLDEGGVIGDGVIPSLSGPTALVGIAEKGFLTVELSTRAPGGHSSLPPRQSAVGILAAAVARLEAEPMPARLEGPTVELFERVAPRFPAARRAAFANLWASRPLVLRQLGAGPATNAMIRTTTAATIFQGGTKDNVLPGHARAVVNFRVLPGDSLAGVIEHVRRTIGDPRVEVRRAGAFTAEPSAVSSTASPSYRVLERTIRSVAPEALVAPFLVVVVTDARYFAGIADEVFRFLPLRLASSDLARIHGIDERIAVTAYHEAIRLYRELILNGAGGPGPRLASSAEPPGRQVARPRHRPHEE